MRYWPVSLLTTERTFSINAGLAASTVTPGRTPPETSLTTPVMAACAKAAAGRSNRTNRTAVQRVTNFLIAFLLTSWVCRLSAELTSVRRTLDSFMGRVKHSEASATTCDIDPGERNLSLCDNLRH